MASVLTISSHVVHGYVGNKAIVFPLQCLGWDVDVVNTVNFSNHTGYGVFDGTIMSKELLEMLLQHQKQHQQNKRSYIITGYVPNKELIDCLFNYFERWEGEKRPIYLMDPILGDEDQLYVDESCIKSYQHLLTLDLIDIATPNQFELELLTGHKIKTVTDLMKAVEILKGHGIRFVIVTSTTVEFPNTVGEKEGEYIRCLISSGSSTKFFNIPLIKSYFTGVGDLFTGLLIDRLDKNYYSIDPKPDALIALSTSVNQVLSVLQRVLKSTNKKGSKSGKEAKIGDLIIGQYELDLIDSRDLFGENLLDYKEYDLKIEE